MGGCRLLCGVLLSAAGCERPSPDPAAPPSVSTSTSGPAQPDSSTSFDPADTEAESTGASVQPPRSTAEVRAYLRMLAPVVVGRSLRLPETERIEAAERAEAAIRPLLTEWTQDPGFAEAIRYLIQTQLRVSGHNGDIDFELPGNLAAWIAAEGLPWTTLLTAEHCVDATGAATDCDTGAPYTAGVLGTRAYMASNTGRFNLGRAGVMLESFACRAYPMEADIQVPLDKEVLIPMFQAESAEDQEVPEAAGGFGNGAACYTCHSQFGAHAQLFVKYDIDGYYVADASGLQDTSPEAELGNAENDLYASHMRDAEASASEASQMFGQQVADLGEAAQVLATSELFGRCTVQNLLTAAFRLPGDGLDRSVPERLFTQIAQAEQDPTIARYVVEVFSDPQVIDTALAGRPPADAP